MSSSPFLPSDEDIVAAARQHEQTSTHRPLWERNSGFPLLQDNQPIAWIKYVGDSYVLTAEAATQAYVYGMLMQQPSLSELIRIPQIYRVIQGDDIPYVLIVMEYVHGRTGRQWLETLQESKHLLWPRVLDALKTLLAFHPPEPIPAPGPVGGGRIVHLVFGEYLELGDAPRDFDSVEDLQTHINQTIDGRNGVANFASEDLKLCYYDAHQSNFILADGEGVGPIYVIDFGNCMWLPISFLR